MHLKTLNKETNERERVETEKCGHVLYVVGTQQAKKAATALKILFGFLAFFYGFRVDGFGEKWRDCTQILKEDFLLEITMTLGQKIGKSDKDQK